MTDTEAEALDRADPGLDADAIDDVLGGPSDDAVASSGDPSPGPSPMESVKNRLLNTSPNPSLRDIDTDSLFSRENGLAYLKRGLGKFTAAGGTALEDFALGAIALAIGDDDESDPNEYTDSLDPDGLE